LLKTPIIFIIFNRPETTRKVFEEIQKIEPTKLLVIADGPRKNNSNDEKKCEITRNIINTVDWKCEVIKNFSESNLGCKKRISSGLDWAFDQVEHAIILEDDCLPHQSFFPYCEELLEKYKNDTRIMSISGINLQFGKNKSDFNYYFSRYVHVWGWATWRRTWKQYDVKIEHWRYIKSNHLFDYLMDDKKMKKYWYKQFQKTYDGKIDTWDHQLTFTCWSQSGLSIIPSTNLVSNIGFGAEASHTSYDEPWNNLPTEEIKFPLKHPSLIVRNAAADSFIQKFHYNQSFYKQVKNKLKDLMK
jgi:hypothetical protein